MKIYIDVREPLEYRLSHVDGAVNMPLSTFSPDMLRGIAPDDELVVYCQSGQRAEASTQFLSRQGFVNVTNGINQHSIESSLNDVQ